MNERIRELAEQAGDDWDHTLESDKEFLKKFAELIIKECVDCLNPLSRNHSMVGAAQDTIEKHFGVK